MYNISVLGCGQLGSRHLQSLLKSKHEATFYAVDPSAASLETARSRVKELGHDLAARQIHYLSEISDLRGVTLDLAVLASGSQQRLEILKNLLQTTRVKNIILEKFLFQREADYQNASDLLKVNGVKAWVNCPRRMFENYHVAKQMIAGPIEFSYSGANWGLACNSIHFLDLVAFLTGEKLVSVSTDQLAPEVFTSKRPGYIEFFGTLKAAYSKGSSATLTCSSNSDDVTKLSFSSGQSMFASDESTGKLYKDDQLVFEKKLPYQSDLTHLLVDPILGQGSCYLPGYEESKELHLVLLRSFLAFVEKIKGSKIDSLPVT